MSLPATDNDRQYYELKIFHDVAKALTSSLDLDTILQTIMQKMAAYFEPATWSLLMLDEATNELYYAAAVGKGCEKLNALQLKSGESLARWVINHGVPLVIADVAQDERVQHTWRTTVLSKPGVLRFACRCAPEARFWASSRW